MPTLTKRQEQVLDYISGYKRRKECAPTQKQIGEALGISPQAARGHLLALRKKGLIDWADSVPGTIEVLSA